MFPNKVNQPTEIWLEEKYTPSRYNKKKMHKIIKRCAFYKSRTIGTCGVLENPGKCLHHAKKNALNPDLREASVAAHQS